MSEATNLPDNPWREFIENCINGSNYFRASEYRRLIDDIDNLLCTKAELLAALHHGYAIQAATGYGKNAKDHTNVRVLEAWMKQAEAAIEKATQP